ncbi:MAG: HAMP domain-containing protein [Herpetosiphonaceae bacterium]|nr:HAMP domain-containing protein [Herpetosiphonaceae bacterium]
MRRLSLSTLLVGVNVTLLLLAVASVATVAVRLLQRLADDQALARVAQTGLIVRQQIGVSGEALHSSAQLLSERPTLRRLVDQHDQGALQAFLTQFTQTDLLDGTVVMEHGQVLAQVGTAVPWASLWTNRRPNDRYFLQSYGENEPLLAGAWATLPGAEQYTVAAMERLDQRYSSRLSTELGLAVTIVPSGPQIVEARNAEEVLRGQAFATADGVSTRLADRALYRAAVPLRSPSNESVGIIEVDLPTASVARSVTQLVSTLLFLALSLTLVAALVSLVLGRKLGRPLSALTDAAASMGRGDLLTPLPVVPSAEIGTLATTLEEMRRRLLQLTNDLRHQQAEAQAIVTGIIEGVFSVDSERRIHYLNPQAAAMLGTTPELALGRFCGDVLRPQGAHGIRPCAEHCPIIHARFRGGARATEHLVLANGQHRTVVVTSAPIAGGLQVQVLRDETEIEAARRARDAILANISHEFRTPLSAQLASIELLLDQLPDLTIQEIEQLVSSQQRGTLRLRQLIDNLLESARIEAGRQQIRRQRVALDEVIEEALEMMRPLLDQQGQTVVIDLPYPLPLVSGDGRRLTQVFVNLLGNAQKFAPKGSTIQVGGSVEDTTVTIWVQDQGPGLPTVNGHALFERFMRTSGEEPEQGGVGLGLWLVKSIVERHGGQVQATSSPEGTRMSVILPREATHENSGR